MSEWSTLILTIDPPVASIVLNRPQSRNAITLPMLDELVRAAERVESDDSVRVVLLTGGGETFSVGFDLQAMAGLFAGGVPAQESLASMAAQGRKAVNAIAGLSAVTVASVQGHAIGGGFLLASACDLRIVAADTTFCLPEIDLGVPLTWGGVPMLCQLLGTALARDVVMTGRRFGPEDVVGTGFAHRVVPSADCTAATNELIADLCAKPARALRQVKAQFQQTMGIRDDEMSDEARFVEAVLDPNFLATAMAYVQRLSNKPSS
jgi:enoyl-CoA hydratase/carnithine racemase